MNKNIKPPFQWRLILLLFLSFLHIGFILFIFFKIHFLILIIFELVFFLIFSRLSFITLARIIIIAFIIFFLNILFYEGKIVFSFGIFKVTEEGIKSGVLKSGVLISLFLFTYNTFNNRKNIFISSLMNISNNNLLLISVGYFFSFLDELKNKNMIRSFFKKAIQIYNIKDISLNNNETKNIVIDKSLYIYNIIIIIFSIILLVFTPFISNIF